MVFSKEKWNGADGIRMFVHASNALSYETMEAPLHQAWMLFIVPLLGESLCTVITGIFDAADNERTYKERMVLRHTQNAVANLALWYDFRELNTRLTDQGHQRQETENFKSVYKYQEDELQQTYRNKGFNSLDALIEYLAKNDVDFPQWASAPANVRRQKAVVRSADEVNNVVFINNSAIIFLRLQPILKKIEQTDLPVLLGRKLYDEFMGKLETPNADIGTTTVEELRVRVGRVMVNKAVSELVRQTGSLTDRGLYFETFTAGREGNSIKSPLVMDEAARHAQVFERDAVEQCQALNNFIEYYIPELFAGRPEDVFKRDNNGKRTVWL